MGPQMVWGCETKLNLATQLSLVYISWLPTKLQFSCDDCMNNNKKFMLCITEFCLLYNTNSPQKQIPSLSGSGLKFHVSSLLLVPPFEVVTLVSLFYTLRNSQEARVSIHGRQWGCFQFLGIIKLIVKGLRNPAIWTGKSTTILFPSCLPLVSSSSSVM